MEIRSNQQWTREVKKRDGNTCRVCGETINLHAHHIKPRSRYPELALELDNGITLCGNCHARLKGKEENTNLKTIIYDRQITDQLRQLNDKFCRYLTLLISEDPKRSVDAVFQLLNHLQVYPDSLNQFLPLIRDFIERAGGGDENIAKRIMLEFLKRNSSQLALQMGRQYETDALVYMKHGRDYLKNSDYDRAIANFDKAIELNPNHASYYARGEAHYKNKNYDRAIEDFTIAIKFNPSHASAYRNRAGAYYNRGEYDRAITDCTKVIELDSNYAAAYYIRGRAYDKKGDIIRSNADFDIVTQLQLSDE